MPICSYVIHPAPGQCDRLSESLNLLKGCSAVRADLHEVILLVTETDSEDEERALQATLKDQPELYAMAMTFGEVSPTLEEEVAR